MANESKHIRCYICGVTDASELPKLGPWDHVECPSCGKYKIAYDVLSILPGLDENKLKQVLRRIKIIVTEKQDMEILKNYMIHDLLD